MNVQCTVDSLSQYYKGGKKVFAIPFMLRHNPLGVSNVTQIQRLLWSQTPDLPGSKLVPIFWPHQRVHTKVQTHSKFLHKLISKIRFLHDTVIRKIGKCCSGTLVKTTPDHDTVCNNLTCFLTGIPAGWCVIMHQGHEHEEIMNHSQSGTCRTANYTRNVLSPTTSHWSWQLWAMQTLNMLQE